MSERKTGTKNLGRKIFVEKKNLEAKKFENVKN